MEALLNVHTCTECECTAHDDTNLTGIHSAEDFELFVYSHPRFHHDNLLLWHTCRYEFLANILIEIKAGNLVLVVVGKDSNGAVVVFGFFEGAKCLTHGLIGLAVGVVLRI